MPFDDQKLANRDNWDSRVDIHYASEEYGVQKFITDPGHIGTIVDFDRRIVGDVTGKRLLHLQCHIGTDTLSWARLGAAVTGIDFSEKAVAAARRLSDEASTPGRFLVAELYDAPEVLKETFDIVYTGVGAINWLPDIRGWAEVVSSFLEPGGRFFIREGHPIMWALDWKDQENLTIKYPYFEGHGPVEESEDTTYAGEGILEHTTTYDWAHGVAETLQALIDSGLRIDEVADYDFCEWQGIDQMVLGKDGRWRLPEGRERMPLMWSILATRT